MRSYKITLSQLEKFIALCEMHVVDTQGKYVAFQHELSQVLRTFNNIKTEMNFIESITDERATLEMEPHTINWIIKNMCPSPAQLNEFKLKNQYLYN